MGEALASVLLAFCSRTSADMDGPSFPCNVQPYQAADHVAAAVSRKKRRVRRDKGQ